MRILLDAHVPIAVARELQRADIDVLSAARWREGEYREIPDEQLLDAARSEGRGLVTFDCRTIPGRLRLWAQVGLAHAGVILIDDKTIRPNCVGGLVRALQALIAEQGEDIWIDRVIFLRPS